MKTFFSKEGMQSITYLVFFAADGSVTVNKRGGCYFSIQSKDRQIICDIKMAMSSTHKISKRYDKRTGNSFYRLQIGSKFLYDSLFRLGFTGRKVKSLPTFSLNFDDFRSFLLRYFDGDGNIWSGIIHKDRKTKHKNIIVAFTSGSYDFLAYLQSKMQGFLSIKGSLFKGKTNYYRLQYSKSDALKIYNFMYNSKTSGLLLKRKKLAFNKAINSLRL